MFKTVWNLHHHPCVFSIQVVAFHCCWGSLGLHSGSFFSSRVLLPPWLRPCRVAFAYAFSARRGEGREGAWQFLMGEFREKEWNEYMFIYEILMDFGTFTRLDSTFLVNNSARVMESFLEPTPTSSPFGTARDT